MNVHTKYSRDNTTIITSDPDVKAKTFKLGGDSREETYDIPVSGGRTVEGIRRVPTGSGVQGEIQAPIAGSALSGDSKTIHLSTYEYDASGNLVSNTGHPVSINGVTADANDPTSVATVEFVHQTYQDQANAIAQNRGDIRKLNTRVDRVGANAAALAALRPMGFDPDSKWDFAIGYGNYRGTNATAVGAFYSPNEDIMLSAGGSFGGGENMVNAGLSFKLGSGSHISNSRTAMAKEIVSLREEVAQLKTIVTQLAGRQHMETGLEDKDIFPDVPENHWAYEAVSNMAKEGVIEGYPDGTFKGDRQMTRYEFASLLYRAMQQGLPMNPETERLIKEFRPELDLVRVDTISRDKAGNPKIERVRVNK